MFFRKQLQVVQQLQHQAAASVGASVAVDGCDGSRSTNGEQVIRDLPWLVIYVYECVGGVLPLIFSDSLELFFQAYHTGIPYFCSFSHKLRHIAGNHLHNMTGSAFRDNQLNPMERMPGQSFDKKRKALFRRSQRF